RPMSAQPALSISSVTPMRRAIVLQPEHKETVGHRQRTKWTLAWWAPLYPQVPVLLNSGLLKGFELALEASELRGATMALITAGCPLKLQARGKACRHVSIGRASIARSLNL